MPTASPTIVCNIKAFRVAKKLSQEDLAQLVGVGRQAIYDMESGRYLPNTAVALRIGKVLGCSVEVLFTEKTAGKEEPVTLLSPATTHRLALARVNNTLVGIPLQGSQIMPLSMLPADAQLNPHNNTANMLVPPHTVDKTVLIMGCDPALTMLHVLMGNRAPHLRAHTFFASSTSALQHLNNGTTHIAGTHFHSAGTSEANIEAVAKALPTVACNIIAFSLLEEGLMVAPNNPLQIREVADLAQPKVRFINRENGAALRKLLDTHLTQQGIPSLAINGYNTEVASHHEGAYNLLCNTADAALGLRIVAETFGLGFVPLATTRCDLVIPHDVQNHPGVTAILDVLQSAQLRNELQSLPGYDTTFTGKVIQ